MIDAKKSIALIKLCREMFTRNLIGTDFDDLQVLEVTGRDFPQQPDGAGYHISFAVSAHAVGKLGKDAHDALSVLCPAKDNG